MYPCSNPELVAAASDAGAIGVVQPVSMTYVYGHDFRAGLKLIKSITPRPFGMNALIEQSSQMYRQRVEKWIDIALEEGVRFFVTSLGNPKWVVERTAQVGGIVYHDVTEAQVGKEGSRWRSTRPDRREQCGRRPCRWPVASRRCSTSSRPSDLPVICAGGVGDRETFRRFMAMGYAGVQMGTRFIATTECLAHPDYKQAIINAEPQDIVLTERLTGVPVAVINNDYVRNLGTRAGPVARYMLRHPKMKHWMRSYYALTSLRRLKKSSLTSAGANEYWQAGKSVAGIHDVKSVREIIAEFVS